MACEVHCCMWEVYFPRPTKGLSCEVVEKMWFWSPRFVVGGILQISDVHFQIVLTSEHVAGFG